jgi:hypothetical protein
MLSSFFFWLYGCRFFWLVAKVQQPFENALPESLKFPGVVFSEERAQITQRLSLQSLEASW